MHAQNADLVWCALFNNTAYKWNKWKEESRTLMANNHREVGQYNNVCVLPTEAH